MAHPADLIKLVFGLVQLFLQLVEGGVFEAGRMGGGVDLLELADGDLGVDLRGGEFGVAEELLDKADVGPVFVHERGAGVAQEVAAAGLAQFGGVDVVAHELGEAVGREGFAQVRGEQRAVVGSSGQRGAGVGEVALDPADGAFADGDHAVFFAFALADHERAPVGIQVVEFQADQLHAAHPEEALKGRTPFI